MTNDLGLIGPNQRASKEPKRLGRGPASGHGKTAGRGHKGSGARKSGNMPAWFEGGQMPLSRRVPKRGFRNPFKKQYALVKISQLTRFPEGAVVDMESLQAAGLIGKRAELAKLLGDGQIDKPITVRLHKITRGARKKLEAAGGSGQEIN
ncbi:MAG: 50S ribosomal protein L15 [Thermodesulfobacteriota bacterium]